MAVYSTCKSVMAPIINSIIEPASSLPIIAHCESDLEVHKVHIRRLISCPGIIIITLINTVLHLSNLQVHRLPTGLHEHL